MSPLVGEPLADDTTDQCVGAITVIAAEHGAVAVAEIELRKIIAVLAAARAISIHLGGGARRWDKTTHIFPTEIAP